MTNANLPVRESLAAWQEVGNKCYSDDQTEFNRAISSLHNYDPDWAASVREVRRRAIASRDNYWTSLSKFVEEDLEVNAEVPTLMQASSEQWGSAMTQTEEISAVIEQQLMLENWRGEGSNAYRDHANTQRLALNDLHSLASVNQTTTRRISSLNTAIYDALKQVLDQAAQEVSAQSIYADGVRGIDLPTMPNVTIFERTSLFAQRSLWAHNSMSRLTKDIGANHTAATDLLAAIQDVAANLQVVSLETVDWPRTTSRGRILPIPV